MALELTVGPGDHLAQIAEENGYGRIDTIVNAQENADLFARRPNPHQLVPGDVLLLPTKATGSVTVPVDQSAEVVVQREPLLLRVKAFDYFGKPIANETGTLTIGDNELAASSDGDGLVEVTVPRVTKRAELRLADFVFVLEVGSLEPVDELAGARARLNNLGFWSGEATGPDIGHEGELSLGVQLFQEELGVPADGRLTDELRAKLREKHGQ